MAFLLGFACKPFEWELYVYWGADVGRRCSFCLKSWVPNLLAFRNGVGSVLLLVLASASLSEVGDFVYGPYYPSKWNIHSGRLGYPMSRQVFLARAAGSVELQSLWSKGSLVLSKGYSVALRRPGC